jgi:hypothetical protein
LETGVQVIDSATLKSDDVQPEISAFDGYTCSYIVSLYISSWEKRPEAQEFATHCPRFRFLTDILQLLADLIGGGPAWVFFKVIQKLRLLRGAVALVFVDLCKNQVDIR